MDYIELHIKGNRKYARPVFWPHKFFAAADREDISRERIVGLDGAAAQFWESIKDSEFMTNHPFLPRAHWNKIIPLGMHGDGGAFNAQDSLYVLSWNSLVGSGSTLQSKFLFSIVRKQDMVADTLDTLTKALSWSFNVLLSGQTPHATWQGHALDRGGEDLARGYRAALCQIRGDWEFDTSLFYFRQWNTDEMCPFCLASATNAAHAWSDFSLGAWWRGTVWANHEDYAAYLHATGRALPVMFRPGCGVIGLRLSNVMVDVLHTIDQGVASHIIANTIWYYAILVAVFGGATYAERMQRCYNDLKKMVF